jgi:hypothetical protein
MIATAIILGLSWFVLIHQREPRYNGRSLSEWLSLHAWRQRATEDGSADAVRHIGTNALPFLIRWVDQFQPMSPRQRRLSRMVVQRWGPETPGREFLMDLIIGRQLRAGRAISAFEILGETARDAAPELERIATRRDTRSAIAAIDALSCLRRAGFHPLLSVISNTALPLKIRDRALASVIGLGSLGTNARPTAVLLIRCLDDPQLATNAALTLGTLHLESDISVPALIECTRSTNATLRKIAVASLGEFGGNARAAVPQVTKLLDDPEVAVRREATSALEFITADTSAPW